MVGALSSVVALVLVLVAFPGSTFADPLKSPDAPSSSSVLEESGAEEEEAVYSGLLAPRHGRGSRETHGLLVHFRVFDYTYDTSDRVDVRLLSFGLVEPFSRLGVGVTLFEKHVYENRFPVMNVTPHPDALMEIASWFPVELHFVPYTFGLPGLRPNRFVRAFLGSIEIYYRYSNRANFLYYDDFWSVHHFDASYVDVGVGFELPFIVLRVGVHTYKIRPSSDAQLSVLETYKDTVIYASAGIGVQALLGIWAPRESKYGFAPWFGVGK